MGLEEEVENSESKNWFQPLGEKLRIKEPLLVPATWRKAQNQRTTTGSSHLEKSSESKNHYWFQPLGEKLRIKEPLLVLGVSKNPPRTAGNTWNGQFLDSD
jgi:hypothetical protein